MKSIVDQELLDNNKMEAELVLNQGLQEDLCKLSNEYDVPIEVIIRASWSIVLKYQRGMDDILFSKVEFYKEKKNLIKDIIPIRVIFDDMITIKELIQSINEQDSKSRQYDKNILKKIVERPSGNSNLNKILFVSDTEELYGEYVPNIDFELFLYVSLSNGVSLRLTGKGSSYKKYNMLFVLKRIENVLQVIANKDIEKIKDIIVLSDYERNFILQSFNNTKMQYPKEKTIVELFEEQVVKNPNKIAVEFGEDKLTFSELNAKANCIAKMLRGQGIKLQDIVGIMINKSVEMLISIFGILKSGAGYLPIDPQHPKDRIEYMIKNSNLSIILSDEEREFDGVNVIRVKKEIPMDYENIFIERSPTDIAYVIYTSGTTGIPKGVVIENKGVVNLSYWLINFGKYTEDTVYLQTMNYIFDGSVFEIFPTLLAGGSLVLVSQEDSKNPEVLLELMANKNMSIIPSMLRVLIEYAKKSNKTNCINKINNLYIAGEALTNDLIESFISIEGSDIKKLSNCYGPTEVTVNATAAIISECWEDKMVTIGKPNANTRIYILENDELCGIGIPGELCVSGDGLARGYLNQEELSNKKFVNNPFEQGQRMYRTGDLAYWLDDGSIKYLGRIDTQVKVKGHRIELEEVESWIRKIENIKEAIVKFVDNKDDKYLCAYVISNTQIEESEVKENLAKYLPEYMVPKRVIQLDKLPKTMSGKIDKKSLPIPTVISNHDYVEPTTDREKKLSKVFKEIFGADKISIKDNFIELGGDSIKAIRIVSKLREYNLEVSIKDIMQNKTIEKIALFIKESKNRENNQVELTGEVPLTPIQKDFFDNNLPKENHFNQSVMLETSKKIDIEMLIKSIKAIIGHHDMLRATYKAGKQVVSGTDTDNLYELIQSNIIYKDIRDTRIEDKCNKIHESLDIENGPIIKFAIFNTEDKNYLFITAHHLVIDAVSWRILLDDLNSAYKLAKENSKIQLPMKTNSFKCWSEMLHRYRDSDDIKKEIEYWKIIEDKVKILNSNKNKDKEISTFNNIDVLLDENKTQMLLNNCAKAYNTEINDLLLTALSRAWNKLTSDEAIAITLEGHGREQINDEIIIDRTVGWFTTSYPIVIESNNSDIKQNIRDIKEMLRRIPRHGIGYGVIKKIGDKVLTGEESTISFNYLGEFGQEISLGEFNWKYFSFGNNRAKENNFTGATILISGFITNKKLNIKFTYNSNLYEKDFIRNFSTMYIKELVKIINHCCKVKETLPTASDFQELQWSDEEFTRVFNKLSKNNKWQIEKIYPLTMMQQGILYHKLLDVESTGYIIQNVFEVNQELNIELLKQSFELLCDKHEVLRTCIVQENVSYIRQVILKGRKPDFNFFDLTGMAECNKKCEEIKREYVKHGFDLEKESLIKMNVVKMNDKLYQLILSFHHIIIDGWCLSILINDILCFYDKLVNGLRKEDIQVEPMGVYETYVRSILSKDVSKGLNYWKQLLHGYDEQAEIRTIGAADYGEDEVHDVTYAFADSTSKKIKDLSIKSGVTINTILETAWGVILQYYSNKDDVVFGKVVSGRNVDIPNIEKSIGLFVNIIPVRIKSDDEITVEGLLKNIQNQALSTIEHDYCPLVDIQRENILGKELIQTLWGFENYGDGKDFSNRSLTLNEKGSREQTKYPLTLRGYFTDTLVMNLIYDTQRYSRKEMERILFRMETVISNMADNPKMKIKELDILNEQEKATVLVDFNQTKVEYSNDKTIIGIFEKKVKLNPNNIAVQFDDDSLTFDQLNKKANRLGQILRDKGIKANDIVALMAEKSIEMIVGIFGIIKSGAAYLPIDPSLPKDRIEYMLKDSKAKVIISNKIIDYAPLPKILVNNELGMQSDLEIINKTQDLAYIIYTSGTTGKPKGVMIENGSVINLVNWLGTYEKYDSHSKVLQNFNYIFDGSVFEIFPIILWGGTLVILSEGMSKDPKAIIDLYENSQITMIPSIFKLILEHIKSSKDINKLDNFGSIHLAGEELSLGVLREYIELGGKKLLSINNSYGPTESTVCATSTNFQNWDGKIITIGRPIANTRIYIFNNDRLCGVGIPGEICIAGAGLARGYLNKPELTEQKFVMNPMNKSERMYRTGDLGCWLEDGTVQYLGRFDNQVKIRGHRIEIAEIENQLKEVYGVKDAVVKVIGKEEEKYLCGYVVYSNKFNEFELKIQIGKKVPEYMIPTRIIQLKQLPKNRAGKVDKSLLPIPEIEFETVYIKPRNQIEEKILSVFTQILGYTNISIMENFFKLGGDSIKAIRVVSKLRELGIELTVKDIMESKTIERIAAKVRHVEKYENEFKNITGEVLLTPIQKEFFDENLPCPNHFNQSVLLESEHPIDTGVLEKVISEIVKHHDMLRAKYLGKKQVIQDIEENNLCNLVSYNLSNQSVLNKDIENICNEIHRSMDIENGVIFKVAIFNMKKSSYLFIACHHLVIDGVSWRIIIEDINQVYNSIISNNEIKLPQKSTSFKEWSENIYKYRTSNEVMKQIDYWRKIEDKIIEINQNVSDTVDIEKLQDVTILLTYAETNKIINDTTKAHNTEINDILLTALSRAWHKLNDNCDISFNLEGHGRENIGDKVFVDRTVGWFTTTYPVVVENIGSGIREDLRLVKETLRRVPKHGIGYSIINNIGEKMLKNIECNISFNYLGQFTEEDTGYKFKWKEVSYGEEVYCGNKFKISPINMNLYIKNEQFSINISFDSTKFTSNYIKELLAMFKQELIDIADYCSNVLITEPTASDYGELEWSDNEFTNIINKINNKGYILEKIYSLTAMQEGMLYHKLVEEESSGYVIQNVFEVNQVLDIDAFKNSFELTTQKYEVLRTSIIYSDVRKPRQIVLGRRPVEIYVHDCISDNQNELLENIKKLDINRGFNLEDDNLVRLNIVKLAEDKYEIIMSFHHIIMDGWSISILVNDILDNYDKLVSGTSKTDIQCIPNYNYETYVKDIIRKDSISALEYWHKLLEGYEGKSYIKPEGVLDQCEDEAHDISIFVTYKVNKGIKNINKKHGITINTIIEAAWTIILQRYTNKNDIVFGKVVSGRNSEIAGTSNSVGLFINTVPVRVNINGNTTVVELLNYLQKQAIETTEYDHCSLAEIQKQSIMGSELIQSLISFDNYYVQDKMKKSSINLKTKSIREQTNYSLTIRAYFNEGLSLNIIYDTSIYGENEVLRLLKQIEYVIEEMVTNENKSIDDISTMNDQDKNVVLYDFNDNDKDYNISNTIIELFEKQVQISPEDVALELDDKSMTYRELNERANYIANQLIKCNVKANEVVGIITNRSFEMIIGIYAILKSGAAYLPIDPELPKTRIDYMLNDSSIKVILSDTTNEEIIKDYNDIKKFNLNKLDGRLDKNFKLNRNPSDLMYIIYTSGTTGNPKGVLIENKNVINLVYWTQDNYKLKNDMVMLFKSNYAFDASVWELYVTHLSGGRLVLLGLGKEKDTVELLNVIEEKKVTDIFFVPSMFNMFLDEIVSNEQAKKAKTIKNVLLGGEATNKELVQKVNMIRQYGVFNPKVANLYGITEGTVHTTYHECSREMGLNISLVGKPLTNNKVYILNNLQLCNIGMPGELCIGGAGISRGYLNRDELNKNKFVEHPYIDGETIFRTGDLGRWLPGGEIQYLGRIDEQVKIRGFRIELGEIESKLRSLENVDEAVVLVKERDGDKYLCGYIVTKESLDSLEVKARLKCILPEYMIPSYIVCIDKMPVTKNGKVDKRALPEPQILGTAGYEKPRNEKDEILLNIFKEILGAKEIGINDSFFELGGDSIKAIRIVSKLRQIGYKLSVKAIMKNKVLKLISDEIMVQCVENTNNEIIYGNIDLTPIQIDFFNSNMVNKNHFNQSILISAHSRINIEYLEKALFKIVGHHDILKARYDESNRTQNIPIKIDDKLYEINIINLIDIQDSDCEMIKRANIIQESFKLDKGPLVKGAIFRTKDKDLLFLCIHHLVVDGVSWRIILEDLNSIYKAMSEDKDIELPSKTTSFQKWSKCLKGYLENEDIDKEIRYWNEIQNKLNKSQFKADKHTEYKPIKNISVKFDRDETKKLLQKCGKTYNTEINDILLTALSRTLSNITKEQVVGINLEGHGREEIFDNISVDRTVGWFTSLYPIVFEGVGKKIEKDLRLVKETLRRIPNNGMGYGIIKNIGEGLIYDTEASITFNYLGEFEQGQKDSIFNITSFSFGKDVCDDNNFGHASININALVKNNQLDINIQYDETIYLQSYMDNIALTLKNELLEIIEHCISKTEIMPTASDFGELEWSDEEFKSVYNNNYKYNREIEKIYPLTPLQEGMLYHKILEESSSGYVVQNIFEVKQNLNVDLLRKSFKLLCEKHEVLRSSIVQQNVSKPRQIIINGREVDFEYYDYSNSINKNILFSEIKANDIKRGFDLEHDCLIRMKVVKLEEEIYNVILNFHHIIIDGWCVSILLNDLLNINDQLILGVNEKDITFNKDTIFERYVKYVNKKSQFKAIKYWSKLLEDYEEQASVRPEGSPDKCDKEVLDVTFKLSKESTKKLKVISAKYGVTVNTIIETAWGIVLQHYNNRNDVVFGKVVSGRDVEIDGINDAVGLFINTIPVRIKSEEKIGIEKLLQDIQFQALSSSKYDYCSLAEIQKETLLGNQLIKTLIAFENYFIQECKNTQVQFIEKEAREQTNYDLTLSVIMDETLTLNLMYNTKKYCNSESYRILQKMNYVIQQILDGNNILVEDIKFITEKEQDSIINIFNRDIKNYNKEKTIIEIFEEQVSRFPNNIAIEYKDERLTYSELNNRANSIGNYLRIKGVGPDSIVGIVMDKSINMFVAIYSVLKSGGAYLPLEPDLPVDRINIIIEESGMKSLLVDTNVTENKYKSDIIDIRNIDIVYKDNLPIVTEAHNLAYVIYTSGTTGKPKGILVENKNVVNLILGQKEYGGVNKNSVILQNFSFMFDGAVWEIFLSSFSGARLVVASNEENQDMKKMLELIKTKSVTHALIVPSKLRLISECTNNLKDVNKYFSSLQILYVGAEKLTNDIIDMYFKNKLNNNFRLINLYGPTEGTVVSTSYEVKQYNSQCIPIGKPIKNTKAYIFNRKVLCGIGIPGELCISGESVTRGYIDNWELTCQKYQRNPINSNEIIYRTGDLARWLPDGNIEYLGRIDDQVKLRGFRIEILEIENAIRQVNNVEDVIVIVKEIGNNEALCAYIVGKVDVEIVKKHLQEILPYYMIPNYYIILDKMPVNRNGKVDKKNLPEITASDHRQKLLPRTTEEFIVLESIIEVLGLDNLDMNDNFFENGGHSLNAARLIGILELKTGIRLGIHQILSNPTPIEISKLLLQNNNQEYRDLSLDIEEFE